MAASIDSPQSAFDSVLAEWCGVADDDPETRFGQLLDEWSAFEWQSGSRTLLAALGLQHQEVPLCRGLAWLLDTTSTASPSTRSSSTSVNHPFNRMTR